MIAILTALALSADDGSRLDLRLGATIGTARESDADSGSFAYGLALLGRHRWIALGGFAEFTSNRAAAAFAAGLSIRPHPSVALDALGVVGAREYFQRWETGFAGVKIGAGYQAAGFYGGVWLGWDADFERDKTFSFSTEESCWISCDPGKSTRKVTRNVHVGGASLNLSLMAGLRFG